MKLSISNIAWEDKYDLEMYAYLQKCNFAGIEIAPTRLIKENPYDKLNDIKNFAINIKINTIYKYHQCNQFGMEKLSVYLEPNKKEMNY
ncbi:Conserved hypothetical protein, beta/alpha TIM barrel motif [Clostridium neonatale]|nr:Conserved hypothetical protein, beta/alpha TIM barrel motif [Clostridium neonatale]